MMLFRAIVFLSAFFGRITFGKATNFSHVGDKWNPDPHAACLHRDLTDTDMVVAHRSLPCRSRVLIVNLRNGRHVIARIGDRGPARALVDLAPAVTRRLRANGAEIVAMTVLP